MPTEPTPPPAAGLTGLPATLANVGAVGVLFWFLWYAVTHQLPDLQRGFHAELQREREELRAGRDHDARQTEMLIRAIGDNQALSRDTLRVVQDTQKAVAELAAAARRPEGKP